MTTRSRPEEFAALQARVRDVLDELRVFAAAAHTPEEMRLLEAWVAVVEQSLLHYDDVYAAVARADFIARTTQKG